MRYNKAHSRVMSMLMSEAPKRADGHLAVCPHCQRWAYFAGGFMRLLMQDLDGLARFGHRRDGR